MVGEKVKGVSKREASKKERKEGERGHRRREAWMLNRINVGLLGTKEGKMYPV